MAGAERRELTGDRLYRRLADLESTGEPFVVATVVRAQGSVPRHEGTKMLVFASGRSEGTVGGGDLEHRVIQAALQSLQDGRPRKLSYSFQDLERGDVGVCGGEMEVFVDPVQARPALVVIGGGHVGRAVVHLASWLGFRVVLSDDRPEYATSATAPGADQYLVGKLAELPEQIEITPDTYILLTTRGVPVDVDGLPALLESPARYIGVIGSRRRWEVCAQELAARGVPPEQIARVHSPIGLELNAETPEEIAVSMLAEIILTRRGGSGEPMGHRPSVQEAG